CHLAYGRRFEAARATDAAERALAGSDEHAASVALLRALVARDGVEQMARDAAAASALVPGDPVEGPALLLTGIAHQLAGDAAAARDALEQAASCSGGTADAAGAVARAQLALLAADEGDWEEADRSARDAAATLPAGAPAPLSALVLSAGAVVAAYAGEPST